MRSVRGTFLAVVTLSLAGQLCAVTVTLAIQPGEYTLLPQTGGLTNGSPEPGVLHDRLQSLPPIVVTGWMGRGTPFYGLVQLPTDVAWTTEI